MGSIQRDLMRPAPAIAAAARSPYGGLTGSTVAQGIALPLIPPQWGLMGAGSSPRRPQQLGAL
ncbi:hypothetical protein HJFPF1_07805 [Paramyrothecium foliicola]|nr:hypothetical protein HJFPF1_07805 [Paramyrothecium foliicola]